MLTSDDLFNLLALVVTDDAERLTLQVGEPPVIHWRGEPHPVVGPDITLEEGESILHSIASPHQVQECYKRGSTEFMYSTDQSGTFRVTVNKGETLQLEFARDE